MTPEQARRLRELPQFIAMETDPGKLGHLWAELQQLTSLELAEIHVKSTWPCPSCGIALGAHNAKQLRECVRQQLEN
jgi:hypothetical protein